jgi:hypothetical protein
MINEQTKEYERKETARLDEMFDDIYDDADAEYDIAKRKYEEQFATAFRARLEQNEFNPDWDAMAVIIEEQQRMAKRIEELVEALRDITVWYSARDSENEILPAINQNPEIYRAMQALAKAEGK